MAARQKSRRETTGEWGAGKGILFWRFTTFALRQVCVALRQEKFTP